MYTNIKKFIFSVLCVITVFSVTTLTSFASNPVTVKLNGVEIAYSDPLPQIISNRTMVPIRTTVESLGGTIDWNEAAATMTIYKDDRVVVHTIRTDFVTVNGTVVTFDTPSLILENRSLMPIRMISESLGNVVSWDDSTRTVNIVDDNAQILNVSTSHSSAESGQSITLTIDASSSTNRIKLVDEQEKDIIIAESSVFINNSDGTKTFNLTWTPESDVTTYKTIKVVPGNTYNYLEENYRMVALSVTALNIPEISYFSVSKLEVVRDEEFTVTVETNSATEAILLESTDGTINLEMTNYALKSSDTSMKVFTETISFSKAGEVTLRAYPGNTEYEFLPEYKYLNLLVTSSSGSSSDSSSDSSTSDEAEIKDAYAFYEDAFDGQEVQIIVVTNTAVEKVEILDSSDKVIDSATYKSTQNISEYVFELYVDVEDGRNRFTVVAYDEDDDYDEQSLTITAGSYDEDDLEILNIQQRDLDVYSGETVELRIITTDSVEEIKIYDSSDNELSFTLHSTSSSSIGKIWNVTNLKVTESIKDNIKVVAYDGIKSDTEDEDADDDTDTDADADTEDDEDDDTEKDDDSDTEVVSIKSVSSKINIFLNTETSGEIISFEISNEDDLEVDDKLEITLYTNTVIDKVWIEDSSGSIVESQYYPDKETSEKYTWYLDFYIKESGRLYYDIYAQDENGDTTNEYFNIRVYE